MQRQLVARSQPSGEIVSLAELELDEPTLPVPISDNGGLITVPGSQRGWLPPTRVASAQSAPPPARGIPAGRIEPGDWIGGVYRIQETLGGGAMGRVFSAFDEALERKVAIKLIRGNLQTTGFRKRFMLEARAMALVSHPNVLTIHALGEHESSPFIVMELVEGHTLDRWLALNGASMNLEQALGIINQVCLGVSAIHAAGTLHRDIKPSNILLHHDLRVRVSDLGLAVSFRDGTVIKELVGTPGYIAPEIQYDWGDGTGATPQSDLYSLGCVAYELLTGQPPFSANDTATLADLHATSPVPLPSSVRPELPEAFDDVLIGALAKIPQDRPASVELFRSALMRARNDSLEPRRILVADDDADFRELLEIVLQRDFPSAEVECVPDGRAAVEAFDRQTPSAVVLDLHMPELDGFGVTALLRARPKSRIVPIIIMTALGGPKEWELLSSLGADRFLVKPVNLDDFVSTIRRALRERTGQVPLAQAQPQA
jgi:eukaryotic-like serine/threonine-protein kinase